MKKLLGALMCCCMLVFCIPALALANVTWELEDGILTLSGSGEMQPHIAWETNRSSIIHVKIEEGITNIGDYAFYDCPNLESVTIPESVTSIGESAFYGYNKLESVTIPSNVTSIGGNAFRFCTKLKSVTISYGVTSIGQGAFSGCAELTSVTIPESVTSIGLGAFHSCTALESITIPSSVTSISKNMLTSCSKLKSVTIAGNVKRIETWAFSNCPELKTLVFTSQTLELEHVGSGIFSECPANLEIYVPEGCKDKYIEEFKEWGLPVDNWTFVELPAASLPQTGDSSRMALWLCLLGMAGAAMLTLKKRTQN